MALKTLLFVAPFTDINSPYASTAYLSGFLKKSGHPVAQADLSIELFNRLLSKEGLSRIRQFLAKKPCGKSAPTHEIAFFLDHADSLIEATQAAVRFLQEPTPELLSKVSSDSFFPSIPGISDSWWAGEQLVSHAKGTDIFESISREDRARYFSTRHIYAMASLLASEPRLRLDLMLYPTIKGYPEFTLDMVNFDAFEKNLGSAPSPVDEMLEELVEKHILVHSPELVGISAPFTSTAYGAFRIAKKTRELRPETKIALGGGFASTELRELSDARVFDLFDFVILDDGEKPLLRLIDHLEGKIPAEGLLRTLVRENHRVVLKSDPREHDVPRKDCGTPSYAGLPIGNYLPVLESLYPCSTKNFQNFRMNKMTLAQGCYWKKCTFCDVSLAYIDRFDPSTADILIEQIEKIVAETGHTDFHFVDEAMPPNLLRALSQRLIERKLHIRWLGMTRFDKSFDAPLARLMAQAGCISVFCGLEVASERMLQVVDKGVTLTQVAQVSRTFSDAGIMVHAYLMYGYPTQTAQDSVDSLEFVRQLFENGCIQSGVWSRFSLTAHSPIGLAPKKYGLRVRPEPASSRKGPRFCRNALHFDEPAREIDPQRLESGLHRSLRFYMHGLGFEKDVREWFPKLKLPKPSIPEDFVALAIKKRSHAPQASVPLERKA